MGTLDKATPDSSARSVEIWTEREFLRCTDIVIQAIESNNRDLFFPSRYHGISDAAKRDEYVRYLYEQFQGKLKLFADRIDDNSPPFDELLILQDSIQALFETFYRKNTPLSAAFPNEEARKSFYVSLRRYVLDNHVATLMELQAKYPAKPPSKGDWDEAFKEDIWLNEWGLSIPLDAPQEAVDALLRSPNGGKR